MSRVTIEDVESALQSKIDFYKSIQGREEFTDGKLAGLEEAMKTVRDAKEGGLR